MKRAAMALCLIFVLQAMEEPPSEAHLLDLQFPQARLAETTALLSFRKHYAMV